MTRYDPNRHHRRSIRLPGYDYTQPGAYFVTICTHERAHLFGQVVDEGMVLNALGEIARQCWLAIPDHFPHATLDTFVIMPNHAHGIIWIVDDDGAKNVGAKNVGAKNFSPLRSDEQPHGTSKTIGSIIRGFKIGVTKWARQHTTVHTVWQRNYYEHIIRDERALTAIRQYILDNPRRWHLDRYNPAATGTDPVARDIWRMLNDRTGGPVGRPTEEDEP
ncbi:transposase [Kallotenue papyrolyticum]|uniref:transposase n=1 Tax=Kallotenue papyrolyticum TaxID=1325125 RepID=UPI00049263A5|nr:transposase [Kallotenue papyrolyticum]